MFLKAKANVIGTSRVLLIAGLLVSLLGCYSPASATQAGEGPEAQVYSSQVFVGSYDEAREIWPFTLKEPTYLPEGMKLTRIFLDGFGHAQRGSQLEATILEEIRAGERTQGQISAAYNRPGGDLGLEAESLSIWQGFGAGHMDLSGVPREARGTVTLEDGKVASWKKGVTYVRGDPQARNLEWVPKDQVYLFWTVDGQWGYGHLGYMLSGTGSITLEELIKVANSLR